MSTVNWIPDAPRESTTSSETDQAVPPVRETSIEFNSVSAAQAISQLPSIAQLVLIEESKAAHSELDSFNHKSGFYIRLLDFLICFLTFAGPNVVAYFQQEELFIVGMIAAIGRVVAWLFNSLIYPHVTIPLVISMWEIRYFVSIPTAMTFCLKFIPAVSKFAGKGGWSDACFVGLTTFLLFGYSIGIRIGKQRRLKRIRKTQPRTALDAGTKRILREYNRYLQKKLDQVLLHKEATGVGLLTLTKIDGIARNIVRIKDILAVYPGNLLLRPRKALDVLVFKRARRACGSSFIRFNRRQ